MYLNWSVEILACTLHVYHLLDEDSKVISLASDLLTKWSSLKEVFRIPKKPLSVSKQ